MRLIERSVDKHGHPLLFPEYEFEGSSTTLPPQNSKQDIIDLYKDYASNEPFHSEFKTDMDLERLYSGALTAASWCELWRRWR